MWIECRTTPRERFCFLCSILATFSLHCHIVNSVAFILKYAMSIWPSVQYPSAFHFAPFSMRFIHFECVLFLAPRFFPLHYLILAVYRLLASIAFHSMDYFFVCTVRFIDTTEQPMQCMQSVCIMHLLT